MIIIIAIVSPHLSPHLYLYLYLSDLTKREIYLNSLLSVHKLEMCINIKIDLSHDHNVS